MATPTQLDYGSAEWTYGSSSFTSASITPGTNCILVLMAVATIDGSLNRQFPNATVTSSGSGPTWTTRYSQANTANYEPGAEVLTAEIGGTDPGSFTVTVEAAQTIDSIGAYSYAIYRVTGYNTGSPIVGGGATGASTGGDGAKTLTQSATPASGDVTFAMSGANSLGAASDATFDTTTGTFTAISGITSGASADVVSASSGYRTGYSTDADIDWSDVNTGTGSYGWAAVALTIADGGGGAQSITPAAASLTLTAGTTTVTAGTAAVTPAAAGLTLSAGTVTITSNVDVTPAAAALTLAAGTVTVDVGAAAVTPAAASLTLTAGTTTVTLDTGQDITPTAAGLTLAAGTTTVTAGAVAITPAAAALTLAAGTTTVTAGTAAVTPAAAGLTLSAGTLTVSTAATVPAAVSDLSGTAGNQQVALTWSAPDDGGSAITDYVVQYRVAP